MAILIKKIDGEKWKKEISSDKITEVSSSNDGKIRVYYKIDQYNNCTSIVCDAIKF